MDNRKIIEIYEILIKGFSLTKEILNIYKFTEEDIKSLLDGNIIKEIDNNKWELTNIDELYKYGIYLEINQQTCKSEECYRVCYKLDPTNRKVCMQLLLLELKRKNYIGVQRMFSLLENIETEKNKKDNNLILYLLGTMLYSNKDYQNRIKNITYEDVLISNDMNDGQNKIPNRIRCIILNQKYPYALNLINDLKREKLVYNVEYELLKELIISAINVTREFKFNLRKAARKQDYNQILELLDIKSRNQKLSNMEISILSVTKAIIEIVKTNKVPEIYQSKSNYLSNAIQDNNFKLAKKLNMEFLEKTNQNPNEDILNILLNDIIYLIEDINTKEVNITKKCSNQNDEFSADEALAYYIKEIDLTPKEAIKKLGILPEQAAIIRLIYARDYFNKGDCEAGNKLLEEVENTKINSLKVRKLLNEIKTILSKEQVDMNIQLKVKTREI